LIGIIPNEESGRGWIDAVSNDYMLSAPGYYGEPNAWHAKSDWDNYFKGELWLGCYSWWWVFGAISTVLLIFSFGVHV